MSTNLELI
jgi:hypothetical protein